MINAHSTVFHILFDWAPWRVGTVVFLPVLVLSDPSLGSKISTCECVSNRHVDPQNPVGT